ncbi:hypothetical protein [Millionella massiliensis]|uniref:hypothetical protein n=1 Tax=Millionella massiliensis TaxID=1871023 RepID=UPI0023A7FD55|nr:hypothetical protein [Millionella massiliensis]
MKRQLLSLGLTLGLSISTALAASTTLKSAQGLAIHGLDAGHTFTVTLRQSTSQEQNGVTVTIDERLKPYLDGPSVMGFSTSASTTCRASCKAPISGAVPLRPK